jgi:hypothetical protein
VVIWTAGCNPTVKVEAPDKPIVVNLNVKIEHKLKLKVEKELENAIKSDSDIF